MPNHPGRIQVGLELECCRLEFLVVRFHESALTGNTWPVELQLKVSKFDIPNLFSCSNLQ